MTGLGRRLGGVLLRGTVAVVLLSACGGAPADTGQAPSAPQATVAVQPTSPPVTAPGGSASTAPAATDLLSSGKLVFEKTAGGVGCAYCHGLDGKGNGPAGVGAPANRGKTEGDVRNALTTVELMSIVKLTDQEITAVAAYLQYLGQQP